MGNDKITTHLDPADAKGIATVALSRTIFVQGLFVRAEESGRVIVRVGDRDYEGNLISHVG